MADIRAILTQKKGPFPVWVYALGAFGITYWFLMHQRSKAAAGGSGQGGSNSQFSSSQSSKYTDPKTGAEINSSYSASGQGYGGAYGSPAQFVTSAGPMPYSGGDVYVNFPGQTTSPTPPPTHHPPPPPPPQPGPPRDPDWGHWATVRQGDSVQSLTQQTLGDANLWSKVWNDPVNKILHDARGGDPSKLQPGDVVWIFYGWKPGWVAPPDFVPYPLVKPPPPESFQQGSGQWYQSPTGNPQYLANGTGSPNSQQTWQFSPTQVNQSGQAA
jgi:hypothetical protein